MSINVITPEVKVETEVHQWEIPSYNLDGFQAKIAQANNKLAKAGLDSRFNVVYTEFTKKVNRSGLLPDGNYVNPEAWVTAPWVRAELVGPVTLSHGHYTFVASLVAEEAGVTVHTVPGQELGGYAPKGDTSCDHCGLNRDRTRLYLVRDERDSSIIQLGHSCIELYTGIAPKGLWVLTFDEALVEFTREDSEGGFSPQSYGAAIDTVLAYAFAHADQGRSYVPASSHSGTPTAGQVRMSLFGNINKLKDQDRAYFIAKGVEASEYLKDTALLDAIKASVAETSETSDYGRNLRVILAGEYVSGKNVGVLASLVKVYARAQQLEAERKANPVAKGFIGELKERVKNISLTLTTVSIWEGHYGYTTLLIGRTADGHVVKWFASGERDYTVGDTLNLEAATVKAHEVYEGQDQTVITRGKIDTFAERAKSAAADIEANGGSGFEAVKKWVADDPTIFCGSGHWEIVGYDETQPIAERWFNSKAELARFAKWQKEQ